MAYFIDSHAHIFSSEFTDDFEAMIDRIRQAKIERVMIMCTKEEEAMRAIAFAQKDPKRFQVAYGIHPEDVKEGFERLEEMKRIVAMKEISCVGEIGLDYHWEKETKEEQKRLFIEQIEIARSVHKPILVHARDAMQDCFDIMKAHKISGVMHCYSGSAEMAVEFTKLGYYIALGGALTFKNSRHAKEVCRAIDLNYLLSETDCPYMAPVPVRGTRNEPSNIPYIVQVMAELRNLSVETVADIIAKNYERFLKEVV